jgi:hypothetical protein
MSVLSLHHQMILFGVLYGVTLIVGEMATENGCCRRRFWPPTPVVADVVTVATKVGVEVEVEGITAA